MEKMALECCLPRAKYKQAKPSTQDLSLPVKGACNIASPNHVWATDITFIRLAGGFVYLVAIIDWFSRFVLSWRLSNSLESTFCVEAMDQALARTSEPLR